MSDKLPNVPLMGLSLINAPLQPDEKMIHRVTRAIATPLTYQVDDVEKDNTATGYVPNLSGLPGYMLSDPNSLVSAYVEGQYTPSKRKLLYRQYAQIEEDFPEINSGLDMYADYTVSGGGTEDVRSFTVSTENGKYQKEIDEVVDRVGLRDKAWSMARGMIRDGDEFVELVADAGGLAKIRPLPKSEMYRNQDNVGNLVRDKAFIQQRAGNVVNFREWQCVHWRTVVDPINPYGRSILWSSRKLCRELALMEDALAIARLSRAHQRLKYTIDVGDATPADARQIVQEFKTANRRQRIMSKKTGRMSLANNPLLAEEDIYIPKHKDGVADVTTIPGDPSNQHIKDVLHKYDRMFAGMKISKAWFGLTGPNIRSVVGEQGLNFMRTVRRIRNDWKVGASKIIFVGLAAQRGSDS